jgi:hypothetical protein
MFSENSSYYGFEKPGTFGVSNRFVRDVGTDSLKTHNIGTVQGKAGTNRIPNCLSNDNRQQQHGGKWKKRREVTLTVSPAADTLHAPQYFRVFLSSLLAIVFT